MMEIRHSSKSSSQLITEISIIVGLGCFALLSLVSPSHPTVVRWGLSLEPLLATSCFQAYHLFLFSYGSSSIAWIHVLSDYLAER